jgi:hypothetical protein
MKQETVAFRNKPICWKQDYLPWQLEGKQYIYFVDADCSTLTKGEWFVCNGGIYKLTSRTSGWINSQYISSHYNIKNGFKGVTGISHNPENCRRIVSTNNPHIDKPSLFYEYVKGLLKI